MPHLLLDLENGVVQNFDVDVGRHLDGLISGLFQGLFHKDLHLRVGFVDLRLGVWFLDWKQIRLCLETSNEKCIWKVKQDVYSNQQV